MTSAVIAWEKYPNVSACSDARTWLQIQADLGLSANTVDAYGRGLNDYLGFCGKKGVEPLEVSRKVVAEYVRDLSERPNPRGAHILQIDSGVGLSNATMQQRLTAVRLFYDHLIEEGYRGDNPVGRGRYTPRKGFSGHRERALIPRFKKLPWIPNESDWSAILTATREEPLRNRVMFALAYDGGLRREELCALETGDVRPGSRLLTIRAETTKNRQARVVPYSLTTSVLFERYLEERRMLSRNRGPLFLSTSPRNRAKPVTIWTWSKVVREIAKRAAVERFSTHTLRHLCLTDLARTGWDIHEIAKFAGHQTTDTTLLYIHLSGRDLAEKVERAMESVHAWRGQQIAGVLA